MMKPRVYLIDYENVGKAGLEGAEALSGFDKVVVLYSENAEMIPIDMLKKCKAKLEFIRADVGTPNAMDFQLVGYLFYYTKKWCEYYIISRDQGFTAVLNMAKNFGGSVSIRSFIGEKPISEKKNPDKDVKLEPLTEESDKVIKFNEVDLDMVEYGIDCSAVMEVSGLIKSSLGVTPTPDVLRMVIDGVKAHPVKSDFYLYCTKTMGQGPGQAFYTSIKKKFTTIKEIVQLAS